MKQVKKVYQQYQEVITKYIFPMVLFFYPFLTVNQGVDVSDSMYSFSNFLFFEKMEGMWVVSTYVSNLTGWILTKLPLGSTVLGMKMYTTLFISANVLLVYTMFRRWMPAWIVFMGEMISIGFCWIPTGILYNYMSYFLFTLGAVLLYQGLVEEKDLLLELAGAALGINVFVRIPNLTQMALIVGLWYYLGKKHKRLEVIVQKTLKCVAGYVVGVLLPLTAVLLQFGVTGIKDMLQGLWGIQGSDETYSAWSMITSVLDAYGRTSKWCFLILLGIAMGMVMFFLMKGKMENLKKTAYVLGMLVLLRFMWGRGMFSFRYYEDYTSMYEWGMIGLYLVWIAAIYMLVSVKNSLEEKLWAVMVIVITLVTPLGSNNYTMQNLNNLFLTAPFTLYTYVKIFRKKSGTGMTAQITFPWKAMLMMLGIMIMVQSVGFHGRFVFRDGMDGSVREYKFENQKVLTGMRTTKVNGQPLNELLGFMEKKSQKAGEVILYGDCPGLSFLLNMPFAISTAWPDLASYSYSAFVEEVDALEKAPLVIIKNIDTGGEQRVQKKEYLMNFMERYSYENIFSNGTYEVYETYVEELK